MLHMFQFILEPLEATNPADPIVTLDPFIQTLRDERYGWFSNVQHFTKGN